MVTRLKSTSLPDEELYAKALEQLVDLRPGSLPELDALLKVMGEIFSAPVTSVSLEDDDHLVFPAYEGGEMPKLQQTVSFTHLILEDKHNIVIEDALKDDRVKDFPHIVGPPYFRSFAGYPLRLDGNNIIGAVGILFFEPHTYSSSQLKQLELLSHAVEGLLRSQLNFLKSQLALDEVKIQRKISDRKGRLLDEVANVSGVGGWELDVVSEEMFWTKRTREIIGVSDDYCPTLEDALMLYPPDVRPMVQDIVEHSMTNSGVWDFEAPMRTASGRHLWVKATGQCLFEDGEPSRMIGAFEDISDTILMNKRLRMSEQQAQQKSDQLTAVISNMHQGLAMFDSGGLLKLWNQHFLEMFSLTEEQVHYGTNLYEILANAYARGESTEPPAQFIDSMRQQLKNNTPLTTAYHLADGRIVSARYSPLTDQSVLCTTEDVTEREHAAAKIAHAAHHDTLTELANRKLFNLHFEDALIKLVAEDMNYVLMLIDLDRFKAINDNHGHTVGDKVLQLVATRLCTAVRDNDLVARLGGDEFAVIIQGEDNLHEVAEICAKRIISQICQPYHISENLTVELGVSIGITHFTPDDGTSQKIIQRADRALYAVKNSGRNNYRFYDDSLQPSAPNDSTC